MSGQIGNDTTLPSGQSKRKCHLLMSKPTDVSVSQIQPKSDSEYFESEDDDNKLLINPVEVAARQQPKAPKYPTQILNTHHNDDPTPPFRACQITSSPKEDGCLRNRILGGR